MLMVKPILNISEHVNRIISIVKAKCGLKNKNEAINLMIKQYEERILEPNLHPEYIGKMKERQKEPTVKIDNFKKHFNLE